jgi:hypothetical protein
MIAHLSFGTGFKPRDVGIESIFAFYTVHKKILRQQNPKF